MYAMVSAKINFHTQEPERIQKSTLVYGNVVVDLHDAPSLSNLFYTATFSVFRLSYTSIRILPTLETFYDCAIILVGCQEV